MAVLTVSFSVQLASAEQVPVKVSTVKKTHYSLNEIESYLTLHK